MPPTISVVIGNYNHGRYLPDALDRFLSLQRYFHEIIVADDCSTDDSRAVLADYAARHPILRVIHNERNLGVIGNYTKLLREAKGDYVVGAAADDIMLPDAMAELLDAIARHPEAALFAGRNNLHREATGRTTPPRPYSLPTGLHGAGDFRRARGSLPIGPAGTFIRRDLFLPFYERCAPMGFCADGVVSCMIIARHPFYFLNKPVATVRIDPTNFSASAGNRDAQNQFYDLFFPMLENEYQDLYAMLANCGGFTFLPPVGRYLATRPRRWGRHTPAILAAELVRGYVSFRYGRLPKLFPDRALRFYRRWRNRIFGKPADYPDDLPA